MKIILLGYMASGKTSIGKKLSKRINLPFFDLDAYIVSKQNLSISDIFKEKGEIFFRKLEHKYLKELAEMKGDFILALGGGTPCYANNMDLVNRKENIKTIYLRAKIPTLAQKLIRKKDERPLVAQLKDEKIAEFVAKHLFERRSFYEEAQHKIDVDDKTKKEIVTEIEELLN